MSKVKNENFVTIQGWMVNELGLKGNELLVYATIYGFSQTENQTFTGSLQYLADWTNSSKQGVQKNLKSLVGKGYLIKNDKYISGVKFCEYYATKLNEVGNKVVQGMQQSCIPTMQQSCTNNIDINNIDNNINNNIGRTKFKKPSLEEVKAYCLERSNNVNAEQFIDYYDANGWKVGKNPMKDWKAAIRTWERRSKDNGSRKEIVPDWMGKKVNNNAPTKEEQEEMNKILNPELEERVKALKEKLQK